MIRLLMFAIAAALAADAPLPPKRTGLAPPPLYSLQALAAKPPGAGEPGKPMPAGVHRRIDSIRITSGRWEARNDGPGVWRLAIRSPGASAVRLHFRRFNAGAGRLWIYSLDGKDAAGPYTARGPNGDGEFWTGVVDSDTVVIDYQPGRRGDKTVPFDLIELSHLWVR